VTVSKNGETFDFAPILMEELNVKEVKFGGEEIAFDFELTDKLRAEGLSREIIRHIQASRKKAGLNVDDRILLNLQTESDELKTAYNKFVQEICRETLAKEGEQNENYDFSQSVKIEGFEMEISLKKA
jgi:isoleucyl-tRNA synthetase